MSDEQLKVDMAALARLAPDLDDLAVKLESKAGNPATAGGYTTPTQIAVHRLVTEAIPGVQRTFAARCRNVAGWSVQLHHGLAATEEHVTQLIESTAPLARGMR
ncbi:hypothetical protein [Mycobacteroides abscessus]|uniref:hypothetical protein n=1 Tax=Mycobacteroides abscessus TaxID=36809 RepID=UPI00092CA84D|nr:hypothetical protein [Mycobacteroides abscessus]DAZ90388.1 TPA_asm: WXG-100 family protein [Mycobacterium phage prophiFSQJ01-1]SII42148.1 Uncharacterised protein [Mycobacteroides abscessus subsp. abscessus]SIK12819.1 Uncharacterised protein [Mycobacteroides abscessus subsp. abscessus]SIN26226.1 Uncharacterised protein [Mycobacteroides abscessus subsp. abscessus]SLI50738.1 Uncharacterised protein [Mycobacteroides abscessus subsp. abscessus]